MLLLFKNMPVKTNVIVSYNIYLDDSLIKLPKISRDMLSLLVEIDPGQISSTCTVGVFDDGNKTISNSIETVRLPYK